MEPALKANALCLSLLFALQACTSTQAQRRIEAHRPQASSGADVHEATLIAQNAATPEPLALDAAVPVSLPAVAPVEPAPEPQPLAPPEEPATEIALFNANTREQLVLAVSRDGHVSAESEPLVEAFFKCRRSGRAHAIEPGVLRVVASIAREFPNRVIEVVSGFRTKPYGVKDSKHFEGRAIDLRVRGVKLTKVRDFVWKNFADIGVGYYGHQNFIHVDHRPDSKDTAWTSAYENAAYEFNPRWAMRIRPPWRSPLVQLDEAGHEHEPARAPSAGLAQGAQASL